ncbi:hypothetical protein F5Y15DRAFT_367659 [Xylariaceae sp. FL0016]|nr:hypothetical protein F5Y15DRAFT_367659 [Xylariaceae sp. FL0016]
MTRPTRCVSDDKRTPSRPTSQHSHNLPSPHSHFSKTRSPHRPGSPKLILHKSSPSTYAHVSSPLKMCTTTTHSHHSAEAAQYYFLPEVDASEAQHQQQGYGWMEPIVIDDDDLMFGGKSLSEWYEEERQTLSYPAEEERRGRQRVRQSHSHSHKHNKHHHHHHSSNASSGDEKKH